MNKKIKLFLIFNVFIFFFQCTIDEPVLPRWSTPFVLPLMEEKIIFSEELVNDTSIVVRGDSLFLELEGEFDPKTISSEDLCIEAFDSSSSYNIDEIEIPKLGPISTGLINITDVLPYLEGLVNQTVTVPETTVTSSAIITDTSDLISMQVTEGILELNFYNNLPFTLAPENQSSNSIEVEIYNHVTNEYVTTITIPDTVLPGGVGSGSAPLGNGNEWIIMPLRLDYQFHILEEEVTISQQVLDSWSFKIDILFKDLIVEEISGRVPSQTFSDTIRVEADDENKLSEARIDHGHIMVKIYNTLPIGTKVNYYLLDVINEVSGVPYEGEIFISRNDSSEHICNDLDGYIIRDYQNPGQIIDSLSIVARTETDSGYITLKTTDEYEVSIQSSDILISYAKGILAEDTLEFEPVTENDIIDYNGFTGGIEIEGAQLLLQINNGINVENILLNGEITGFHKNDDGQVTDSAVITITDERIEFGSNQILFEGPEVDNLVNILPTDLKASGFITYGGQAEVSVGDTVVGNYLFTTPFRVQIVNPEPIKLDPDTLDDIDEDIRNSMGEEIQYAKINASIINHSPLGGEAQIFISADFTREDLYDTTAYFNPDLEFIKNAEIPKGQVDPLTGFVNQASQSQVMIDLNNDELKIFQNPMLRTGILVNLEETGGFVILRGSDFLEISGKIEIKVLFKDE